MCNEIVDFPKFGHINFIEKVRSEKYRLKFTVIKICNSHLQSPDNFNPYTDETLNCVIVCISMRN